MKLLNYSELKPNTFYFMYPSHNLDNVTVIETESDGSFYIIAQERPYNVEDAMGNIFVEIAAAPKLTQDDLLKFKNGESETAWDEFNRLNHDSCFPSGIEGYWRQRAVIPPKDNLPGANMRHYRDSQGSELPWPVPLTPSGYNKDEFLIQLMALESGLKPHRYRGISMHRLTGKSNGCAEYEYGGWNWPEGFKEYIKLGVPPSQSFYKFVTGKELSTLPTYGRV